MFDKINSGEQYKTLDTLKPDTSKFNHIYILFPFEAKIPIQNGQFREEWKKIPIFHGHVILSLKRDQSVLTTVQKLAQTNSSQYHWSPNTHWDLSFSDLD